MSLKIPNLDQIKNDEHFHLIGEALDALGNAVENLGIKSSMNPQGNTNPPAAPNSIQVTANTSGIHRVSITDTNPRTRNVHYFIEHSTDRNFAPETVQVEHLGVGRQRSIPQSMGKTPVFYRAYAQYPDGTRSKLIYFGSSTNPTGVIDNATVVGPPHHEGTGSGTSGVGGYGFGNEAFVSQPTNPGRPPKVFKE